MGASRAALVVICAGVLTFAVVYTSLEFSPSAAAPVPTTPVANSEASATPELSVASDSLTRRIEPNSMALAIPVAGSESLLRDVQPGDRLDIVASLTSPDSGQPLTAVVVRGATALQALSGSDPLLVEVPSEDAVMLAHLVLSGTHLSYVLWSANATAIAGTPVPMDDQAARVAFGLTGPTPTSVPTPVPAPTIVIIQAAQPTPSAGSGFLYQVQPNDTWDTIASIFGMPVGLLRQWNETNPDSQPVPGSLVFIPRS